MGWLGKLSWCSGQKQTKIYWVVRIKTPRDSVFLETSGSKIRVFIKDFNCPLSSCQTLCTIFEGEISFVVTRFSPFFFFSLETNTCMLQIRLGRLERNASLKMEVRVTHHLSAFSSKWQSEPVLVRNFFHRTFCSSSFLVPWLALHS